MKHYYDSNRKPAILSFLSLLFSVSLIIIAVTSEAQGYIYTFDGTFTGFQSFNQYVTFQDVGVVLGETPVSYSFEVDFNRDTSTLSSSYGTWNYFYSDLLGQSVVAGKLNGISPEENQSYDVIFPTQANLGELVGGSFVRINARSSDTEQWKIENWAVGQEFAFSDGTVPSIGGYAVYLYGNATLTSITVVPEPLPQVLLSLGLLSIPLWIKRRK